MTPRDRRHAVLQSTVYNGIDFVEIANSQQTELRVHFLNGVAVQGPQTGHPTIRGGETIPTVAVLQIDDSDWGSDDGHVVLTLRVPAPGDFSDYTLSIPSPALDRFFAHVAFSFKANCPSDLDCKVVPPPCPTPEGNPPPIDYLAKDFLSFRQALLDFSTLRYPQWQERSEADFGVMFLEALSAVADDLSYTQDRVATEATLATATQRRSLVRHARLVDYEPQPALSANVMLRFDVAANVTSIPHGLPVIAPGPDGSAITFETGTGLRDVLIYPANSSWNGGLIKPYWFDDSERCLKAGATRMHVAGHGYNFQAGQSLLIETQAQSTADPPIRQIVQLVAAGDRGGPWAVEVFDELFLLPATRIVWRQADKLTLDRDLTRTTVAGNLVPATQGRTVRNEPFLIGPAGPGDSTPSAIERTGSRPLIGQGVSGDAPPVQLYTLGHTPVAWMPQLSLDSTGQPLPEIMVSQQNDTSPSPTPWSWFRRLLNAGEFDEAYMLEAARYQRLGPNSDRSVQFDYGGENGDTVRFGDGIFGVNPEPGTRFSVTYRFGAGSAGNVAADAITQLDPVTAATGDYLAVTNPLPATGGADPQTAMSIQRLAPQDFRARRLRAVVAEDYEAAAEKLPWVSRAGTVFRWTGSWLTVFTTPDPVGSEQVALDQRLELVSLLNRYRMAGYESYVPDPVYVSLDLEIDVCAQPDAFEADVKSALLVALSPGGPPGGPPGFFAPDRFTFGQPLERSVLEAAIQKVPGVAGVVCIHFRVRGRFAGFTEMGDTVPVGTDQILRCDNDPSAPDHGTFSVTVAGGR